MPDDIPSFRLVFRHKDALHHGIILLVVKRGAVCPFRYAVKAVARQIVAGYEYRLGLTFCPLVKAFIVELLCTIIYVCALIGNVAIDYAILWYLYLGIIKVRRGDGQITHPRCIALGMLCSRS